MKRVLILLIGTVMSFTASAQDRNVIWQHGLIGSDEFWRDYAADFARERRMVSTNRTIGSLTGVPVMANDIRNATLGAAGARTIGIGHSMGGVALREIQARTAPGHVGGIITVGSSLNGAQIANTVGNGQLRAFISDGVNELTKGPARQLFAASYIIARAQTRTFTGRQLQEVLLNEIGLDNLVLAAATNNTVVDFTTTGNYMNQARQYNVTIPRVSIYGTEASPVHYRMASSFIGFRDTFFPDIFRAARGVYNAYYIKNLVSSINILNISSRAFL